MANEAAAQYEKLYKQDGSIQKVINGLGEQMVAPGRLPMPTA